MIEQDSRFLVETWSLYALGAALLLVRFAVRFRTVGPKEFQGDDYFAMATLLFFTLDALIVHLVCESTPEALSLLCLRRSCSDLTGLLADQISPSKDYKGSNADFTEAELMAMSQSQLDQVVVGSKLELTAWYEKDAPFPPAMLSHPALHHSLTPLVPCFLGTRIPHSYGVLKVP